MDNIAFVADELVLGDEVKSEDMKSNKRRLTSTNENTKYSMDSLTDVQLKKILKWVENM